MKKPKAILFWSSGKDSAWTLHTLRNQNKVEVAALVTTVNPENRIAAHSVRGELLDAQAKAIGIPLWKVPIPKPCSNERYEEAIQNVIADSHGAGVSVVAFGDLHLLDIRDYREKIFANRELTLEFPIWGQNTSKLASEMIDAGLRAKIICIDRKRLPDSLIGRDFDHRLLQELPSDVDPCGERGEFHTFAYSGPMFKYEIPVLAGRTYEEDHFLFMDLTLKADPVS